MQQVESKPFEHVVIPNFLPEPIARAASAQFPRECWERWHKYGDGKLASVSRDHIPPAALAACDRIATGFPLALFRGSNEWFPDFDLYGAGLHAIPRGGRLGRHVDAAQHPRKPWRRRLSVVWFGNLFWRSAWGGELVLVGPEGETSIRPEFNTLVAFKSDETTVHGVPETVHCPPGVMRQTLAVFWWQIWDGGHPRTQSQFFD